MGTSLGKERYTMLVDRAKTTGSLPVADEICSDLCFDEGTQPSLMQELGAEQTVVAGNHLDRTGWRLFSFA